MIPADTRNIENCVYFEAELRPTLYGKLLFITEKRHCAIINSHQSRTEPNRYLRGSAPLHILLDYFFFFFRNTIRYLFAAADKTAACSCRFGVKLKLNQNQLWPAIRLVDPGVWVIPGTERPVFKVVKNHLLPLHGQFGSVSRDFSFSRKILVYAFVHVSTMGNHEILKEKIFINCRH